MSKGRRNIVGRSASEAAKAHYAELAEQQADLEWDAHWAAFDCELSDINADRHDEE